MAKTFLTLIILFTFNTAGAASTSPVGIWRTIDGSGKSKGLIEMWVESGELKARIAKLLGPSNPNPKCTKCKGARKNQPIKGMVFIWGLKRQGNEWSGGTILDPANGKEYKAKIKVMENGTKLSVRGFVGFSMFGRTQVWERVK